ncbi:hypothetical protein M413DRAFT_443194 [Hebeloma cylindrosporum]|uniref:Uncharacterized protein n=1 Tax=Hebeloma cylindrosporum TaxID=76867 RepID=A0A0C3CJA1_HEBCY|nr:hypothetical protein M413DRAFT_443194 [Hebeloma cylindrosporum h7]
MANFLQLLDTADTPVRLKPSALKHLETISLETPDGSKEYFTNTNHLLSQGGDGGYCFMHRNQSLTWWSMGKNQYELKRVVNETHMLAALMELNHEGGGFELKVTSMLVADTFLMRKVLLSSWMVACNKYF